MTIEIFKHKSGIEVILDKNDSPLIGVNFRVKVGSCNEDETQKGISHFIEHMAFTGTSTLSKDQITKEIEESGAYLNAYTDYNNTTYTVKCMTSNFGKCLSTISDMLSDTQFFEEEMNKERGVILQEISDRLNNPNAVLYDRFFENMYTDKCMDTNVIGTKESVSSFTKENMVSYYKKYYIPENMILSVAGNVDMKNIIEILDTYFPLPIEGEITLEKTFTITDTKNITYNNSFSQDNILWVFPLNSDSSFKTENVQTLVNMFLGSGYSSILFKTIRDEQGLVYGISSYIYSIGKNNKMILLTTSCDSDKSEKIYEELPKSLELMKNMTENDLNSCKNREKFNVTNTFESRTRIASGNLEEYQHYGKIISYDENISIIDSITLEECHEFINELLNIEPIKFISKSSKQKEV